MRCRFGPHSSTMRILPIAVFASLCFASCSVSKKLDRSAKEVVLSSEALATAHVGISVYEPATGKYWYNHQGDKYFVPASNVKIPTCYAAMKYLGDSLVAARIVVESNDKLKLYPAGDPTFLNAEFKFQPLLKALQKYKQVFVFEDAWKDQRWGSGWSWNDYDAAYMAERSVFPIFGNVATFQLINDTLRTVPANIVDGASTTVGFIQATKIVSSKNFEVQRSLNENDFYLKNTTSLFSKAAVPLRTDLGFVCSLLDDTLKSEFVPSATASGYHPNAFKQVIHSQPTDSLLRPMMHRSDNFFAEQSLLMVSNERLGYMSDEKIIDTLLKTDFKDLPQEPRWADGSGLSRYNLFTPQDLVFILNKMKNDFGMSRLKEILPTGGEGTLSSYYKKDSTFIYAKTGTLSGVVALSGFLETKKGKNLIFSVLVNNHQGSATAVRRAVEKFIQRLRERQ